ncbi:MAG TPA: hypothetical protein VEG64_07290 [Candidatus Sulfotelmatobacter sp.]|nr:hypothetical protein [Candidatus Sulfotelmatobacter sp.]
MEEIKNFFLSANRRLVFVIAVGIYLAGNFDLIGIIAGSHRSEMLLAKDGLLVGLLAGLSTLGFFVWLWSMGSFFNSVTKPELRLKASFFRFALVYAPLYIVFFVASFTNSSPQLLAVILPPHLLGVFCVFYALWFVSKSLVLAETGAPASFHKYAGPFFLLWFFPVGIWIIQPRVNRLYAQRNDA